jgi:sRNA-binding protein
MGYKCLMRSAEISGLEELEAEMEKEKAEKKAAKKAEKAAKKAAKKGEAAPVAEETPASEAVESAPEPTEMTEASAEAVEVPADPIPEGAEEPQDSAVKAPAEKKKESSFMMTAIMVVSEILAVAIAVGLFIVLPAWLYDDVLARYIPWVDADNRFAQSVLRASSVLSCSLDICPSCS